MVAGAYKADLLADLREIVDQAITQGTTLQEFRKGFDDIVEKHGWNYNGGRNWRTRVIYETNLRTSYQAGRYAQMKNPALLRVNKYWRYVHSDLVVTPRPEHLAWDGLVLPHDDPFWNTHFPPNGWGCKCRVVSISERQMRQLGKSEPDRAPQIEYEQKTVGTRGPSPRTVMVPKGIDPGWDYAPGATVADRVRREIAAKRAALPDSIGDQLNNSIANIPEPPEVE
jgi:hypothetical protein